MYFYEKPLDALTAEEWEKICMRCGKCCLCKYSEDGVIHFSNCICDFFDLEKGGCSCYKTRIETANGDCRKVDMDLLKTEIDLLPPTCAYRRLYEGKGLPLYHPLISGKPLETRYAVQSLPIYSLAMKKRDFLHLLQEAQRGNWEEQDITRKTVKLQEKYALKWLETYPLRENKTGI